MYRALDAWVLWAEGLEAWTPGFSGGWEQGALAAWMPGFSGEWGGWGMRAGVLGSPGAWVP